MRPNLFISGDKASPISGIGVELAAQVALDLLVIGYFTIPEQEGQGVEEPFAWITRGHRVKGGFEAKGAEIEQKISRHGGAGTFLTGVERIFVGRVEIKLETLAFQP